MTTRALQVVRGRVVARDGASVCVRSHDADRWLSLAHASEYPQVDAGALVELTVDGAQIADAHIVRGPLGDYPGPRSEVRRMPRARLHALTARAQALAATRAYFTGAGFLEVETPLLVRAPGLELHLDAVEVGAEYLITSPEYQMKRLLAAGCDRIFQICKCFRAGERGPHHTPEFSMIEWYRGWDDLEAIARDVEALVAAVARAVAGRAEVSVGDRRFDVGAPWDRITVRQAMRTHAGVDVVGDESAEALAAKARAAGHALGDAVAWDDVFFAVFVAAVEPGLAAHPRPLLLTAWPAPLAALARLTPGNPAVAERFEAYIGGIELANAFGELTDPDEQAARFDAERALRGARGRPRYPIDPTLLAALREGLPPSGGIALGFDRLLMLALGATRIDDVLAFADHER